jgi:hypothetical protein
MSWEPALGYSGRLDHARSVAHELVLLLAHGNELFLRGFFAQAYRASAPGRVRVLEAGALRLERWPNERNWTLRDATLNLSIAYLWLRIDVDTCPARYDTDATYYWYITGGKATLSSRRPRL